MVLGYKSGKESVEERLKFFKTDESVYIEDIKLLKVEIQMKDIAIKELRRKLEIVDNCKQGLGYENYNAILPPYAENFMPSKLELSFTGLDDFANKPVVENYDAKTSETKPKDVRKNNDALISEKWVSYDDEEEVTQPKIEQKTIKLSIPKIEFFKPKQPEKKARKTIKQGNIVNAVKASTYWVWKPKTKVIDHVSKHNSASITLKFLIILMQKTDPIDVHVLNHSCDPLWSYVSLLLLLFQDEIECSVSQAAVEDLSRGVVFFVYFGAGKAKKNVRLMMDELFEMELELILLFWTTAKARTINGEGQIHAKVDGRKVIIFEASIMRDLQFGDE
nr:hypothetical protein [Tanacetum cinerariifolium]